MTAALPSTQLTLFDRGAPVVEPRRLSGLRRIALDETAWVECLPGWVTGEAALMEDLVRTTAWRREQQEMYGRTVDVPRLVASLGPDGPVHPLLVRMRDALTAHYATKFVRVSFGFYRNGADSVAWHGDRVARELSEALVATVSLGEPRRFLLRPKNLPAKQGGRTLSFSLGRGDLFVMGGTCQRTWQHAIPKVAHAGPRLAIMYRPVW